MKLLGLTFLSVGGITGYTWYDPAFRKFVEENVPNSKEVMDSTFKFLPSPDQVL